ncbi:MAG TPA: glycosyltransferase [Gemmatimonadales bacterium]|nr:glycosyltransferase [Gemmatimonadales bacterium]
MERTPVSLIVVNYGNQCLAGNLLRSLARHPDRALIREAVVVDNGYPSMGDSRETLGKRPWPFPVRFAQFQGHSYPGSVNLAAESCTGPILLLANNDIEWLTQGSMAPMVKYMLEHPDVGIAGPQLVFPDGRWQRSAGAFPSLTEGIGRLFFLGVLRNRAAAIRDWWHSGRLPAQDVDFVDGACMAVSRRCFDDLGGWDPAFDFSACDAHLNWQAKQAGWRRTLVPSSRVMHVRGASSSSVRRLAYTQRLFAAKRTMVERMRGRASAMGYDVLQRIAAVEYAFVYGMLELLWGSPDMRRRADAAWVSGLAALPSTQPTQSSPQNT